jgi:hypothetical protein
MITDWENCTQCKHNDADKTVTCKSCSKLENDKYFGIQKYECKKKKSNVEFEGCSVVSSYEKEKQELDEALHVFGDDNFGRGASQYRLMALKQYIIFKRKPQQTSKNKNKYVLIWEQISDDQNKIEFLTVKQAIDEFINTVKNILDELLKAEKARLEKSSSSSKGKISVQLLAELNKLISIKEKYEFLKKVKATKDGRKSRRRKRSKSRRRLKSRRRKRSESRRRLKSRSKRK